MATIHFLKGTYYGKLGDTIGQRRGNTSIVRPYVKPVQPNTPAQLAARARFTDATHFANFAMRLNAGVPAFRKTGHTERGLRQQAADFALRNGATGYLATPLYPLGYTPNCICNDIALIAGGYGNRGQLTSTIWATDLNRRGQMMAMVYTDTNGRTDAVKITQAHMHRNSVYINWAMPRDIAPNTTFCIMGASYEDNEYDGVSLTIPPMLMYYSL